MKPNEPFNADEKAKGYAIRPDPNPSLVKKLMARLTQWQQHILLTPAQARRLAEDTVKQHDIKNSALRQRLRECINALVLERSKPAHNVFEVKLVINRAVMETCVGEQAALDIAIVVAKGIVERYRRLAAVNEKKGTK